MGTHLFYLIFIGAVLRSSIIEGVKTGGQIAFEEHLRQGRENINELEAHLGKLLFEDAFGHRFSDAELNEFDLLKQLTRIEDPSPYTILKVTNKEGISKETVVLKSVLDKINQQVDAIGDRLNVEALTGFIKSIDLKYPDELAIDLLTLHMKRRAQRRYDRIKEATSEEGKPKELVEGSDEHRFVTPENLQPRLPHEDESYDAALEGRAHKELVDASYTYEGKNLAKLKQAGQKSTEAQGYASRAVDGNTSGIFRQASCTHTAYSAAYTDAQKTNPYWWVKLTDSDSDPSVLVRLVTIYNRDDCCWDRLADIEVRVLETCDFCNDETPTDVTPGPEESAFSSEDRSTLCFFQENALDPGKNELFCQNGAVPGRYVVVRIKSSMVLSLCEVEVYETLYLQHKINLAEGKPTEQSSTVGERDAKLAVDGYLYSVFWHESCSHTLDPLDATMPPWWRVELVPKSVPPVEVAKASVTSGVDSSPLSEFSIWVGDEETGIYDLCYFHEGSMVPGATEVLTCSSVLAGRHVRITLEKAEALVLCEVRVFGPEPNNSSFGNSGK